MEVRHIYTTYKGAKDLPVEVQHSCTILRGGKDHLVEVQHTYISLRNIKTQDTNVEVDILLEPPKAYLVECKRVVIWLRRFHRANVVIEEIFIMKFPNHPTTNVK